MMTNSISFVFFSCFPFVSRCVCPFFILSAVIYSLVVDTL